MYSFAVQKALCDFNPVQTVKPVGIEKSRERVYTEEEIKVLWNSFENETEPFCSLFKMLLVTAQRLGETSRMKWNDIEDNTWIIPKEETKANRTQYLPLSSFALAILEERRSISGTSDFVFESPRLDNEPIKWVQYSAVRIRKDSGINDFRIHDLRRTAASFIAQQGVDRTVLGKILNHKGLSGDSSVTAIYDRHEYIDEKVEALNKWASKLKHIIR
jgi:integrase